MPKNTFAACSFAGALALVLNSCQSQPDTSVLLIVVDTLRGDRLGAAGYSQAHTPVLDSLAAHGVLFTQAGTPVPVTLPAVASLLTGQYPPTHGVRDNDRFVLKPSRVTLPELFLDKGYRTAAVLGSAVLNADRGLSQGFEIYDDNFTGPYASYRSDLVPLENSLSETRRRADTVTDLASNTIRSFGGAPYFAMVHYFDVHMHYDPPPSFAAMHPGRPYDGEVSFVDHEIGRLLASIPNLQNTLVLVVSDHGESQNEHGEPQHGFLLYESTLHVPVIAGGPGIPAGLVRDDPISLVDLSPTLSHQFRLDLDEADGQRLRWDQVPQTSPALYAETLRPLVSYDWAPLRSVRFGHMKLIQGGGRTELYDLSTDPDETHPLPATPRDLQKKLDGWAFGDDPEVVRNNARGVQDSGRRELLESLGYIAGTSESQEHRPHPSDALPDWVATQKAKELLRRGVACMNRMDFGGAIAFADSILSTDPEHPEAWYLRGESYQRKGLAKQAMDCYRRGAVSASPAIAHCCRARMAELGGRGQDAYHHWKQLYKINPWVWEGVYFLSEWHIQRSEFALAIPYLNTMLNINPQASGARFDLGIAYLQTGSPAQARMHFATWLENNPKHPRSQEIKTLLAAPVMNATPEIARQAAAAADSTESKEPSGGS